jgi:hypothetical protein
VKRWLVALLLAGACSSGDDEPAARLDQVQVLGTHNSYHLEPEPPLLDLLRQFDAALADSLEYSHPPLDEQFDAGIRQIELDVFADPEGGLYASRAAAPLIGQPAESGDPALDEPGFKVLHVQDIDFRSTCPTFVACLTVVRDWSADHPDHVPILVLVEVKQDPIPDPLNLGFVVPHVITAADLDALDAEIRSVFGDDEMLTPDEVRGDAESLEAAVLDGGWPAVDDVRGQVLFALDNTNEVLDLYVDGHPSLEGRVLFTSSPRGTPEAAFLKLNDPIADGAAIADAVEAGYLVRTRADSDTAQARSGVTAMRDAAFASGAQFVSTDYPEPDPRFDTGYAAPLPGGGPVRCNPVSAPPACTVEE